MIPISDPRSSCKKTSIVSHGKGSARRGKRREVRTKEVCKNRTNERVVRSFAYPSQISIAHRDKTKQPTKRCRVSRNVGRRTLPAGVFPGTPKGCFPAHSEHRDIRGSGSKLANVSSPLVWLAKEKSAAACGHGEWARTKGRREGGHGLERDSEPRGPGTGLSHGGRQGATTPGARPTKGKLGENRREREPERERN
jgi:hypothetical protein